jgi:hypothetical protein
VGDILVVGGPEVILPDIPGQPFRSSSGSGLGGGGGGLSRPYHSQYVLCQTAVCRRDLHQCLHCQAAVRRCSP